jgi:hypothetical protein
VTCGEVGRIVHTRAEAIQAAVALCVDPDLEPARYLDELDQALRDWLDHTPLAKRLATLTVPAPAPKALGGERDDHPPFGGGPAWAGAGATPRPRSLAARRGSGRGTPGGGIDNAGGRGSHLRFEPSPGSRFPFPPDFLRSAALSPR